MTRPNFLQVPPDSTGKKMAIDQVEIIEFDTQTIAFVIGDIVVGGTSGATGTITSIVTTGFAPNAGRLYLSQFDGGAFINDEPLEVLTVQRAAVDLGTNAQTTSSTQHIIVSDPNNPENKQKIDEFGASVSTFTEGAPQFGPFGTILIGESTSLQDVNFVYGLQSDRFYDNTATGGTITFNNNEVSTLLSTTTADGSTAQRTTHEYSIYRPGTGQLIEISCICGDVGKTNLTRRWGYYDANNGVFFELDDTTLYVVLRTNTSGSVVDTRIAQADWNVNALDGTDANLFNLDVTKANIYWIDFQWLGAGRVRFGVYGTTGKRKIAHEILNANINGTPYMGTGSLPLRVEQFNAGGTTVSSSEYKWICGSVKAVGRVVRELKPFSTDTTTAVSVSSTELPLISIRPKTTFNSQPNHAHIIVDSVGFVNTGTDPILFRAYLNTALTSDSFSSADTESVSEIDTAATAVSGGKQIASAVIGGSGDKKISVAELFVAGSKKSKLEIFLEADESTQTELTFTAERLSGSGTNDIYTSLSWTEEQL